MDISLQTVQTVTLDDKPWIASAKGTDTPRPITIDPSKGFSSGTHYPDGFLLSGVPLGIVTTGGLYGLYDDGASDGRETCVGFLYTAVRVNATNPTTVKLGAALFWEGVVRASKLPVSLDANGQADLAGNVRFE